MCSIFTIMIIMRIRRVLYVSVLLLWFFLHLFVVFFFKQKTAYDMRISDWSSDVALPISERTAPAPPIRHRSNRLAKSDLHGHRAPEWCRSTSLISFGSFKNRGSTALGPGQPNPLQQPNLFSNKPLGPRKFFRGI